MLRSARSYGCSVGLYAVQGGLYAVQEGYMLKKMMMILVATNVIASRLLECRPTGMPTARAKINTLILAEAIGVSVGRRSGGRLATALVVTINIIIFFHFPIFFPFSVATFSHRRSAEIKKLI